ncbi:unnamed protein product [Mytilus coruscus]|uniref:HAT C-terminal dimerisation domain-containing protein n=1 Tax=Mytilus coruscus TaxID=42192 RepID=A0A6J8DUP1_MYTCO|nr:unnamed protein product [Mytilus coruscus]
MVAIFQCLRTLYKDCTAVGHLKKMRNVRFLAGIYILTEVLPKLAKLSKTFQESTISFACIEPCIEKTTDDLDAALKGETVSKFEEELGVDGKYETLELNPTQHQLEQMKANHFYDDVESRDEVKAKWASYKYHLMKIKDETQRDKQEGTLTEYTLQKIMQLKSQQGYIFPKLAKIAAVILSLPVSNAWPERGASAVKRIKNRMRNRLKNTMLSSLLQVAVNGPPVCESEQLMKKCVQSWYEIKSRRKLQVSKSTLPL